MEGEELSHWYLTVGGALYDPGGGGFTLFTHVFLLLLDKHSLFP